MRDVVWSRFEVDLPQVNAVALQCPSCGAPLPEAVPGATVDCRSCEARVYLSPQGHPTLRVVLPFRSRESDVKKAAGAWVAKGLLTDPRFVRAAEQVRVEPRLVPVWVVNAAFTTKWFNPDGGGPRGVYEKGWSDFPVLAGPPVWRQAIRAAMGDVAKAAPERHGQVPDGATTLPLTLDADGLERELTTALGPENLTEARARGGTPHEGVRVEHRVAVENPRLAWVPAWECTCPYGATTYRFQVDDRTGAVITDGNRPLNWTLIAFIVVGVFVTMTGVGVCGTVLGGIASFFAAIFGAVLELVAAVLQVTASR